MRNVILFLAGAILTAGIAGAQEADTYEVTITNVTGGQTFTPFLAVTHKLRLALFEPGQAARSELAELAESGNIEPMTTFLGSRPATFETSSTEGLLEPGQSVTLMIQSMAPFNRLSFAAMLIPTNDTFVALDAALLPEDTASYTAYAWDAGSEVNDETCANIPGPACGGEGVSVADGEGFVHVSGGIHGIADLDPAEYDWRNPVATVRIKRLD